MSHTFSACHVYGLHRVIRYVNHPQLVLLISNEGRFFICALVKVNFRVFSTLHRVARRHSLDVDHKQCDLRCRHVARPQVLGSANLRRFVPDAFDRYRAIVLRIRSGTFSLIPRTVRLDRRRYSNRLDLRVPRNVRSVEQRLLPVGPRLFVRLPVHVRRLQRGVPIKVFLRRRFSFFGRLRSFLKRVDCWRNFVLNKRFLSRLRRSQHGHLRVFRVARRARSFASDLRKRVRELNRRYLQLQVPAVSLGLRL